MRSIDKSSDEAKGTLEAFDQSHAAACSYLFDLKPIEPATVSVRVPGVLFPDAEAEKQQRIKTVPTDAEFETFWKAYPRRVDKTNARVAFTKAFKLLRKTMECEQVITTIMIGVGVYATHADPAVLCYPTTWLNGCRWEDEADGIRSPEKDQRRRNIAMHGAFTEEKAAACLEDAVF